MDRLRWKTQATSKVRNNNSNLFHFSRLKSTKSQSRVIKFKINNGFRWLTWPRRTLRRSNSKKLHKEIEKSILAASKIKRSHNWCTKSLKIVKRSKTMFHWNTRSAVWSHACKQWAKMSSRINMRNLTPSMIRGCKLMIKGNSML